MLQPIPYGTKQQAAIVVKPEEKAVVKSSTSAKLAVPQARGTHMCHPLTIIRPCLLAFLILPP
jgi:hypothetical protein